MSSTSESSGCIYVPLSNYDWSLYDILTSPRGRCHGVSFAFNPAVWCLTAALHAATVWMALGLNVQLLMTFKRRTTLYFWSILVTTWGILICTISFDLRYFTEAGDGKALSWLQSLAWIIESMGFSFVLYSRLHLIADSRKLKIIPPIIVCLDVIVHILVLVGKERRLTPRAWHVLLMFVPAFFTAQETILSSLYIYLFIRFMRQNSYHTRTQSMFRFLIFAEIFIICFDVAMVTLNSLRYEIAKLVLTPFFYAAKLKMEFVVLNRLVDFKQSDPSSMNSSSGFCGDNAAQHRCSSRLKSTQSLSEFGKTTRELPNSPVGITIDTDPRSGGRCDDIERLERQYLGRTASDQND